MGQRSGKEEQLPVDGLPVDGLEKMILVSGVEYDKVIEWLKKDDGKSPAARFIERHGGIYAEYKDFAVLHPGRDIVSPGGREIFRPLTRSYYDRIVGLVFVLTLDECPDYYVGELRDILHDVDLENHPVVVMANKRTPSSEDKLEDGKTVEELLKSSMTEEEYAKIENAIFSTVASEGQGVEECVDWLICEIKKEEAKTAVVEPWLEVTQDVVANGKSGLKVVNGAWKKLLIALKPIAKKRT